MMKVIARKGLNVPREDNARRYITDAQAVEVDDSAYYLRCLRNGDLLPVAGAPDVQGVEALEAPREAAPLPHPAPSHQQKKEH
ncbi:DUF2635 domain-containing protein [Serratia bockelmannii]|uniref:DUF2635 domain-containing protein n=1 Tax=Serratia bockelmannii TaxID=2703793 RepID=UPI003FA78AB5